MLAGACAPAGKTAAEGQETVYAGRARATLDSLYARYGIEGENLLRENYPSDETYAATYLADAPVSASNPYSYLWPYSGTFSAVNALYEATGDSACIALLEERVLPGLEEYSDTTRTPQAYASYVRTAPASDRFYDDNVWLGIDFTDMYAATGNPAYLDKARMIWKFIESGTDDVLGGGIYWCEQKKHSKNTCSNAPGSVYALKLFKATGDSAFLEAGRALYDWTKATLQDSTDGLYFDNINLSGKIGRAKYAYNSGQMIQSGALLYSITRDSTYLEEAQRVADAAYRHFFDREATDSAGVFPLLRKGDIWFTAVMLRGFEELYKADGNPVYMEAFRRNLDYAWEHARDNGTGLFHTDFSGNEQDEKKWLLTQAAMAEMMARVASFENNENQK